MNEWFAFWSNIVSSSLCCSALPFLTRKISREELLRQLIGLMIAEGAKPGDILYANHDNSMVPLFRVPFADEVPDVAQPVVLEKAPPHSKHTRAHLTVIK